MTDETRTNEAEANAEEQPVNEASTEAESAPEAVAEVEAAAEEPSAAAESAPEAVAGVEAAAAEPAAEEPSAEAESVPEAVAEVEAVAEEPAAEETPPAAESAPQAERGEAEPVAINRVEGPANFNRAKQGNQRRNPRHVGSDVRIDEINYKNVLVLSRFVDNYGRIHNRRKTRVTAKMQRKVTRAIKRARHLALMPYTGEHMRITGRRS
ncbi:MAG: 30S ribosomal protein S18 [Caldilineaceae bacterium]|nr:30S ribosomal protein S18 [Caldilineaceae bacterium]MDE0182721.1 30S ribosomal protein S18 [Caldilineaceae bacterium]